MSQLLYPFPKLTDSLERLCEKLLKDEFPVFYVTMNSEVVPDLSKWITCL